MTVNCKAGKKLTKFTVNELLCFERRTANLSPITVHVILCDIPSDLHIPHHFDPACPALLALVRRLFIGPGLSPGGR